MEFSQFIRGTCTEKCPREEINMRQKYKLLHKLEMVPGTEKSRRPTADINKTVKSFSRSAAGQETQAPENLRTYEALLETVYYLLHDAIYDERYPWLVVYNFIMDRLRSVRQDMVVQDLIKAPTISILQPIIRFYAYAAYRLCEEPIANFDPAMNNKHLQECLKKLLVIYDDCSRMQERFIKICPINIKFDGYDNLYIDCRPIIEAIYVLHNLGDTAALTRCINLNKNWRKPFVDLSLKISLSYTKGNWVSCCKLIKTLPSILAAVASLHLPAIRRKAFLVMSTAYNSLNQYYPVRKLQEILLYPDETQLIADLEYYNIECKDFKIEFIKNNFNAEITQISPKRQDFVDEKFQHDIHEIILYGWT